MEYLVTVKALHVCSIQTMLTPKYISMGGGGCTTFTVVKLGSEQIRLDHDNWGHVYT